MEELDRIKNKLKASILLILFIIVFCILILFIMNKFIVGKDYYKNKDFNIKNIYSKIDKNENDIDDYSDILLGARKIIGKKYNSLELLSKSLKYAGYDIYKMIEEDYILDKDKYGDNYKTIRNVNYFLKKYTLVLSNDVKKIKEFNYGDIVIYKDGIGIVSDKRNREGISFIIYEDGGIVKEEDILENISLIGHYRFFLE